MKRIVILAWAVALVVTACGSTTDVGAPEAATAEETVEAEATATADETEPDPAEAAGADEPAEADEPATDEPEAGEPAEADEPEEDTTSTSSGRSDLAASVASEDDPISALLGFESFEDPSFLVNQQRRVDALTQQCMLNEGFTYTCLLYTSPSPRDATLSRMPSSA